MDFLQNFGVARLDAKAHQPAAGPPHEPGQVLAHALHPGEAIPGEVIAPVQEPSQISWTRSGHRVKVSSSKAR